ncbi:DUF5063 domain-containing protein [Parabacteroides pacaensis]|uniref:DUF5063 domain-containing protein n=1 Tax=Parabacteroides pacaensis TaxID=2086575 RepID=UPI000D10A37A|nr:DUF5063 domain-containing protein [Parabacteroides pacaensis]
MEKENNPVYDRNTIEFVAVALEFCNFVETSSQHSVFDFVNKATKLLPLLYLKATLLPDVEAEEEVEPDLTVTEDMYESIRTKLATLLGEHDTYLDTFHPDMKYSDAPIAAFISENLADVYQDAGNFVALFREGNEDAMREILAICKENFRTYWGGQLLNALKALHTIRYDEDANLDMNEEE